MRRFFLLAALLAAMLPFISCSARISGSLAADGSASLTVNTSLEPMMTALMQRMMAAGGVTGEPILNGAAISTSMANAPGISSASFRNTTPSAIEGTIQISRVSEFLPTVEQNLHEGFITFEQSASGGRSTINLNLENGPIILSLLSGDVADFMGALMAPIATGERMSRHEYLELVAMVFNRAISNEIANSRIRASIDFPGPVTSVRGGTFSGRRAEFDIPLLDLLVLETPLVYEVEWR